MGYSVSRKMPKQRAIDDQILVRRPFLPAGNGAGYRFFVRASS